MRYVPILLASLIACAAEAPEDSHFETVPASSETTAEIGVSHWRVQSSPAGSADHDGLLRFEIQAIGQDDEVLSDFALEGHRFVELEGEAMRLTEIPRAARPFVSRWLVDHGDHHGPAPSKEGTVANIIDWKCFSNCADWHGLCVGADESSCIGKEMKCWAKDRWVTLFWCGGGFLAGNKHCRNKQKEVDQCWEDEYERCTREFRDVCHNQRATCERNCEDPYDGCSGPGGPY